MVIGLNKVEYIGFEIVNKYEDMYSVGQYQNSGVEWCLFVFLSGF